MNDSGRTSIEAPNTRSWELTEDLVTPGEILQKALDEAVLGGLTPISTGTAALLTLLAGTTRATNVVEVGTVMGGSALALMEGMDAGGVITSIDSEAENQLPARSFLAEAGYPSSRFRLIAGNPLEVLPKLRDGAYDIVFINGDKLEYVEYVANSLRLLRHGGLLVLNDVLWYNKVADEMDDSDEAIIMREALEAVTNSESYRQSLLPVGNGVLVASKH